MAHFNFYFYEGHSPPVQTSPGLGRGTNFSSNVAQNWLRNYGIPQKKTIFFLGWDAGPPQTPPHWEGKRIFLGKGT